MRHRVLYAEAFWARNWRFALFASVAYGGFLVFLIAHDRGIGPDSRLPLLTEGAFLAMVVLLLVVRARSYLELETDGLAIQGPLRRTLVPWARISRVRVQPLKRNFEDARKRMRRGTVRGLLDSDAIFLRLDSDVTFARYHRRLGSREAHDGQLVFPVSDPQALADELQARLPRAESRPAPARRRRR